MNYVKSRRKVKAKELHSHTNWLQWRLLYYYYKYVYIRNVINVTSHNMNCKNVHCSHSKNTRIINSYILPEKSNYFCYKWYHFILSLQICLCTHNINNFTSHNMNCKNVYYSHPITWFHVFLLNCFSLSHKCYILPLKMCPY